MIVFSIEWFEKYQKQLLWFANTAWGKYVLRIHGDRSGVGKNKIIKIEPFAITWAYYGNELTRLWDGISVFFKSQEEGKLALSQSRYGRWIDKREAIQRRSKENSKRTGEKGCGIAVQLSVGLICCQPV